MVLCVGNQLAVEPFARSPKTVVDPTTGLARIEQFAALTPVKVVFGNPRIPAGATVWLRSDAHGLETAKREISAAGQRFVLVPEAHVVLVDVPDARGLGLPDQASAQGEASVDSEEVARKRLAAVLENAAAELSALNTTLKSS